MNSKRDVYQGNWAIRSLSIFAIFLGMALTFFGLTGFDWPKAIPWQLDGFYKFIIFLFTTIFLLAVLSRLFHKKIIAISALLTFFIGLISSGIWPLIVVIYFLLSSGLLGRWILLKIKIKNESWPVNFLVGAAIYGFAVGIFAHFPINYSGFYTLLLLIPIILEWKFFKIWCSEVYQSLIASEANKDINWINVLVSAFGLVYVVTAYMPEIGYDALSSHLFIPGHLLHRNQWGFDVGTYIWAVMPAFGDWIYSILYLLGGESAARLINVCYIFLIAYLVKQFTIWAGIPGSGADWAPLLFISSPLVFAEGNSLFIDSIWTAYILAGILIISKSIVFCRSETDCKFQYFLIASIFFGTALATKVLTIIFFPILFFVILCAYKKWLHTWRDFRLFIFAILILIILSSSAYIYAWYITGNPVFPFYNKFFNSPLYPPENFIDSRWNKGVSWDFLYRAIFNSGDYLEAMPGVVGFQWLLIFLPSITTLLFTKNSRVFYIIAVASISIGICFYSTAYLRYIFPAFALLCGVCGIGITYLYRLGMFERLLIIIVCLTTLFLNAMFFPAGLSVYEDFPLQTIVGDRNKDLYLLKRLPLRRAVNLVNQLNIDKTPVAIFATPQVAGLSSDALYVNWYNTTWAPEVYKLSSSSSAAELLILKKVNFLIIDVSLNDFKESLSYIKQVTKILAQYGSIEVRTFDDSFRYKRELLSNSNPISPGIWVFRGDSKYIRASNAAIVNVHSPITQIVKVNEGGRYRNRVKARCIIQNCMGRVQINWLDSSSAIIGSSIEIFNATDQWNEYEMVVTAPQKASMAEVYGTGHSDEFLEIQNISMSY